MTQTANDHDADDCLSAFCTHPVHENEEAVIDLGVFLGDGGLDVPELLTPVML